MTEEEGVDVEICCDGLADAAERGCIQVVETEEGDLAEVIPDAEGKTAIAINFCPFCGAPRSLEARQMMMRGSSA